MDISSVIDEKATFFIQQYLRDRQINVEFYKRVPEDKFDFRMVDTPQRRSNSVRESLLHQIDTLRDYVNGVRTGKLEFGKNYQDLGTVLSKDQLLKKFDEVVEELIKVLLDSEISAKKVKVPWSESPLPAIASLWGVDSHEILHQGWNLAIMDHLGIERFPELKKMWG